MAVLLLAAAMAALSAPWATSSLFRCLQMIMLLIMKPG